MVRMNLMCLIEGTLHKRPTSGWKVYTRKKKFDRKLTIQKEFSKSKTTKDQKNFYEKKVF